MAESNEGSERAGAPPTAPPSSLSKGQEAELELRGHFHGRRAGQRIHVPLDVELVCFERNVGARTVNLSRAGVLIEVLDTRAGGMSELVQYCEEISRLFAAGGTLDFACGVSRTVHVVRITAGGLGGRMVPLVACRFTEALTPVDFAQMGIDPAPAEQDVPDPVDADPSLRPRVVREVPVEGTKRKVPAIHELVRWAVELDATDIHVKAGSPPRLRVNGQLTAVGEQLLSDDETRAMVRNFLTKEQWETFDRDGDLDTAYALDGVGRFRINVLRSRGRIGMVMRRIPQAVPDAKTLGLAPACLALAGKRRGLVLVTGGSGSGKTTTLAAMIRHINETRRCHIITLEDPIEYVHEEIEAEITQREVGHDTKGFAEALHRVVRQDPDVIMVGEMRDLETIKLAVTAAETGHLVFATLHTTSAAATVDRIVDVFPADQQRQVRIQLSGTLLGIVSQVLVPCIGSGRAVAQEVLIATDAVRSLIREAKTPQIQNSLQTGASEGMQTLEDGLNTLVRDGVITYETAVHHANSPQRVRAAPVAPEPPPIPEAPAIVEERPVRIPVAPRAGRR
ncbi:MAG: type IV pilus twitching motility protein PilT [Planctomycetota bacterium]